jgi:Family of unknown function (DUF6029)
LFFRQFQPNPTFFKKTNQTLRCVFTFVRQNIHHLFFEKSMKLNCFSWILVGLFFGKLAAQTGPSLSGNIKSNGNFFIRDEKIGAANTPQYDRQLFGAESWLTLNYSYKGFDAGLRFDLFNNSNLPNPTDSYSAQGIGRWYIRKKVQKLDVSAGYIYDQIGVGSIFRAFEERNLNIDNALYGVRLGYNLTENWKIKAFTGKQKFQFDNYSSIIKGAAIDGFMRIDSARGITISPGAGIVGRTFDNQTISDIVGSVSTYTPRDSIGAQANTFAASFYNTLTAGNFSWYVETSFKSRDVYNDPNAEKLNWSGSKTAGKLVNRAGSMLYTNVTWTKKKFGATLEGKRTQNFTFRVNPFVTGPRGAINWLPPMARQNTYRLTARFQPAVQELGEQSVQADLRYAYSKKLLFSVNLSAINDLDGGTLYREMYTEAVYKYKRKWQLLGGFQLQNYNKTVYEGKPDTVRTITPYAEFLYKITPRRSVRTEIQYMHTPDDFGSWAFALVEIGLAPHWIFTVSDMYKIKHKNPAKYPAEKTKFDNLHFWTAGVVYVQNANRFSLDWVKQVEGIVCSGGICRYEPAFNGVRLKVSSNF